MISSEFLFRIDDFCTCGREEAHGRPRNCRRQFLAKIPMGRWAAPGACVMVGCLPKGWVGRILVGFLFNLPADRDHNGQVNCVNSRSVPQEGVGFSRWAWWCGARLLVFCCGEIERRQSLMYILRLFTDFSHVGGGGGGKR